MSTLEGIMLLRLILEILAVAPSLVSELEDAITEMKASPNGTAKTAAAAAGASAVAATLATAVKDAAITKENANG